MLKRNVKSEMKSFELGKKTDHENDIFTLLRDTSLRGHFQLINQPESFLFGIFRMVLSHDSVI